MTRHQQHDLYWCPVLFETDQRRAEHAHEEYCLWADLDEVNPRKIQDKWRPTIAWQTSPGRYQALWLITDPESDDLYGAAMRGADNHRMTAMLGADPSGWDITQLLRIPKWVNHKDGYGLPQGKLLWTNGPRYDVDAFNELPTVDAKVSDEVDEDRLTQDLELIDRNELMTQVKVRLSDADLSRLLTRQAEVGKRSETLFVLMEKLAQADFKDLEIVKIISETVWNKFKPRPHGDQILMGEAVKACRKVEERRQTLDRQHWYDFIRTQKTPEWLVRGLITKGTVGFIAGEPKTRKSWLALDLAFSVAMSGTGWFADFLNYFPVERGGPVLFIALEDGGHLLKDRGNKIWRSKIRAKSVRWRSTGNGVEIEGVPDEPRVNPQIDMVHMPELFSLGSRDTITALNKILVEGYQISPGSTERYAMVIIDTYMRAANGSDGNSSSEVMGLLDPLTKLAKRHHINLFIVHHFNKTRPDGPTRGGSRLLGSQALHAWAEESFYLPDAGSHLVFETESKVVASTRHTFDLARTNRTWWPLPADDTTATPQEVDLTPKPRRPPLSAMYQECLDSLISLGPGPHTTREVADTHDNWQMGITWKTLSTLVERGHVEKVGTQWESLY